MVRWTQAFDFFGRLNYFYKFVANYFSSRCNSGYRFIGVWQQDIAKDHSERTV